MRRKALDARFRHAYPSTEYRVTARFDEGDPSYDWILLFLVSRSALHFDHKVDRGLDGEEGLAPLARIYRQRQEL